MSGQYTVYHLHSDLSNGVTNIDSVTKYGEYIAKAKECGMNAMGFSEHGSVFEWWHKKSAIEAAGMKYIHAVECYLTTTLTEKIRDNYHCVLLAKNYRGFLELNRLVSNSFCRKDNHFYYAPRITFDELFHTSDNILVTTACVGGVLGKGDEQVQRVYLDFLTRNRHRCFLEVGHHMDAYRSRSRKGFYMGGRVPYGFELENTVMEGIKTCMYKPIPEQIQVVQLIFSLYAMPQVSFADVVRYLSQNGIKNPNGKNFSRMRIRDIITNPVYAKADASIFEFFHGQGTEIINDISQFIGTNGAYLYTGNKAAKRKSISLDGHVLVLAPHAGCIDADTWIRCRRKCLNVRQIAKPVKAKNTWLAGKIKCIDCGHALSLKSYPRKRSADARYYICNSKYVSASCDGVGAIQAAGIEDIVFDEMSRKLKEFNKLSYKEKHGDPIELTKLKIRAEEIEKEIATLIDKIVSASTATMEYINERIDALDEEKKTVKEKIAQMSAEMYDRQNIGVISDYMSKWNDISIDDKLTVVDTLIESIHVGHGKVKIAWKI